MSAPKDATQSITLERDGVRAVVRAGDRVPMTDGTMHAVLKVDGRDHLAGCVYLAPPDVGEIGAVWYYRDGKPNIEGGPLVHFGVLAGHPAALAAQPDVAQARAEGFAAAVAIAVKVVQAMGNHERIVNAIAALTPAATHHNTGG